jgi:hypothetical protein
VTLIRQDSVRPGRSAKEAEVQSSADAGRLVVAGVDEFAGRNRRRAPYSGNPVASEITLVRAGKSA